MLLQFRQYFGYKIRHNKLVPSNRMTVEILMLFPNLIAPLSGPGVGSLVVVTSVAVVSVVGSVVSVVDSADSVVASVGFVAGSVVSVVVGSVVVVVVVLFKASTTSSTQFLYSEIFAYTPG